MTTAQDALDTADANLAGATLTAPIAGTVGSLAFAQGGSASPTAGIVIVGGGAASVTVDIPMTTLPRVKKGQQVEVTAAGATSAVAGTVSSIGLLPATTTGATPTYPVAILVPAAGQALSTGSRADVAIVVSRVTDVLTVPASAVTTTGAGAEVVSVLAGDVVTRTPVTTGAVGGGLVEVTKGLTAGQQVVVADTTLALPTTTTAVRGLTGGAGGLGGGGLGGGGLGGGTGFGGTGFGGGGFGGGGAGGGGAAGGGAAGGGTGAGSAR
ncbi:MAG: hypothetical protein ABI890_17540 [Lapillicoccus sp.]